MKKLVLFAAVAVAISLSACKKTAQEPAAPVEEVPVVVEEVGDGLVVEEDAPAEEVAPAEEAAE